MARMIQTAGSFAVMALGPRPLHQIDLSRITAIFDHSIAAAKPVRIATRTRRWLERDANERLSIPPPDSPGRN